jgi:hypothetical protein
MFTEVARDNMSVVCLSISVKLKFIEEYHPNEILELITMRQNGKYVKEVVPLQGIFLGLGSHIVKVPN